MMVVMAMMMHVYDGGDGDDDDDDDDVLPFPYHGFGVEHRMIPQGPGPGLEGAWARTCSLFLFLSKLF